MLPVRLRPMTTGFAIVAVLLLQWLPVAPAGAAVAPSDTWNLAQDFAVAPNQANPNPDAYGNPAVWSFVGLHGGTSVLLPDFVPAANGVSGLEQWQGPVSQGGTNAKLPAVGVNATGVDQHIGTLTWPAGAIRVAPWARAPVGVVWTAPVDGGFNMSVNFQDIDPGGGNGAAWFVRLDNNPFGSGYFVDGGGGGSATLVFMSKGETLSFFLSPFQGDFAHDSTLLDVTITQAQT
jgi:hypothetical protein